MTQQNFADYIGMSPASLSSIFNGRTRPTMNIIEAIKNRFPDISTDWLLFGKGTMYQGDNAAEASSDHENHEKPVDQMLNFDDAPTTPSGANQNVNSMVRVNNTPKKDEKNTAKLIDKIERKITEIRIFYDDQTWETFVPKK